jgi:hypothetical protein
MVIYANSHQTGNYASYEMQWLRQDFVAIFSASLATKHVIGSRRIDRMNHRIEQIFMPIYDYKYGTYYYHICLHTDIHSTGTPRCYYYYALPYD